MDEWIASGADRSLWLATAPPAEFWALDVDLEVDVAVIGGGIAGVTTALALKRDGARVAVLERGVVAGGGDGLYHGEGFRAAGDDAVCHPQAAQRGGRCGVRPGEPGRR